MTKDFFKEHDVKYEELDVASDTKARNDMVEKSGQLGVPVIDIDGKIIVGFNKQELSRLLKIH